LQKGLLVCVFAIVHFLLEPVRKAAFNHHLLSNAHATMPIAKQHLAATGATWRRILAVTARFPPKAKAAPRAAAAVKTQGCCTAGAAAASKPQHLRAKGDGCLQLAFRLDLEWTGAPTHPTTKCIHAKTLLCLCFVAV